MSTVTMESSRRNQTRVRILAVGLYEADHCVLRDVLSRAGWTLVTAATMAEAVRLLERDPVSVIVCESELPDGGWRGLLEVAATGERPSKMIVTSRLADDHLWAEVLNLGGYDVLSRPLDGAELSHALGSALQSCKAEGSETASRFMLLGI